MAGRRGNVWWGEHRVGGIEEDQRGLIHFAYDAAWLDGPAFPVSLSLPLSNGDQPVEAHSYFAGLLPEAGTRQRICRQQRVDGNDDMGLLLAIGGDCAGALSVFPEDQAPDAREPSPEPMDEQAIQQLVRSHGHNVTLVTGEPQRFSLAGAQDKLSIRQQHGVFSLPNRHSPSTHILKFETIAHVCLAEYLANRMADAVGLNVVTTSFVEMAQANQADKADPCLLIDRYDRQIAASGEVTRLHQEDVLQALGEPASMKYQSEGGPGFDEVARLVRGAVAQPALAITQLRDWQIFNYLCGNWDGHAKNISLLYLPGNAVPTLAPFYDIVAIEFLNHLNQSEYARQMALYVGKHASPEHIGKEDWHEFARQLGVPPRPLLSRLEDMAGEINGVCSQCLEDFASQHGDHPMLATFAHTIRRRSEWVLNSVLRQ